MLPPNFRKVAFVFDRSISIAFKSGLYGGRYVPRGCNWGAPYFNFRPSARGDLIVVIVLALLVLFQFPSLREGRHARRIRRSVKDGISISAPPRGATVHHLRKDTGNNISIPAPPRGATLPVEEQPPGNHISIPAPPRGATVRRSPRDARSAHFNSRPSARGDGRFCSISPHLKISIHAPPRGATANSCTVPCSVLFQFSPLREGRRVRGIDGFLRGLFQFSPLREGRPQKICNFCKSFVQPLQISMA